MFKRNAKAIDLSDAEDLIQQHGVNGELNFNHFKDVFLMNADAGSACSPTPFLKTKTPLPLKISSPRFKSGFLSPGLNRRHGSSFASSRGGSPMMKNDSQTSLESPLSAMLGKMNKKKSFGVCEIIRAGSFNE